MRPIEAQWVTTTRKGAGLTRQQLAAKVGETYDWVRNRESGRVSVSVEDARRIARALGLGDAAWQALRKGIPA